MSYLLEKERSLKKNINTIALEEIEGCLYSLENLDIHEAVHDIRKRLKKLRALARLFRDEMGEENYKEINIFFRDLGRELSDLRDLTAHMETLEILKERYGKFLYVKFFKNIVAELEVERAKMTEELKAQDFFSNYLPEKLNHAKDNFTNWPLNTNEIEIIVPSIQRVYARGKKALKRSYKNQNKENFHEWRKRVKYLWYQTLLLQETWPQLFETMEAEIHQLADFLGDDHDLMVLKQKIHQPDFSVKDEAHKDLLEAIVDKYSETLRAQAKTKGELIYAEKPDDFSKRIGNYTNINWN